MMILNVVIGWFSLKMFGLMVGLLLWFWLLVFIVGWVVLFGYCLCVMFGFCWLWWLFRGRDFGFVNGVVLMFCLGFWNGMCVVMLWCGWCGWLLMEWWIVMVLVVLWFSLVILFVSWSGCCRLWLVLVCLCWFVFNVCRLFGCWLRLWICCLVMLYLLLGFLVFVSLMILFVWCVMVYWWYCVCVWLFDLSLLLY